MNIKLISTSLMMAAALSSAYAKRPLIFPQVLPEDEPVLDANVAAWKAAPARKAHKMLVIFSNDAAEWHGEAVSYAQRVLEKACVKGGWRFDSADYSVLDDGKLLTRYDAIVMNNPTHVKVAPYPAIETNLDNFVKGGKGIVFIHSAVDGFFDCPALQCLSGGAFWGHPWTIFGGVWGIRNEQPNHPLNAGFGGRERFKLVDELYQHSSPPFDRKKLEVLLSVDLDDAESAAALEKYIKKNGADKVRADRDFAVSWCRTWGKGRVFYTTFGHDKKAFLDPMRLHHILDAVQYALGDR